MLNRRRPANQSGVGKDSKPAPASTRASLRIRMLSVEAEGSPDFVGAALGVALGAALGPNARPPAPDAPRLSPRPPAPRGQRQPPATLPPKAPARPAGRPSRPRVAPDSPPAPRTLPAPPIASAPPRDGRPPGPETPTAPQGGAPAPCNRRVTFDATDAEYAQLADWAAAAGTSIGDAARERIFRPLGAVVHHLHRGIAACAQTDPAAVTRGVPGGWPAGHLWSTDWRDVNCTGCLPWKPVS